MLAAALATILAACTPDLSPDTAAVVGDQELSVSRLADVLTASQAPIDVATARGIAELWTNYQLAGVAAARSDTLSRPAEMDVGLWSVISNMRVRALFERVSPTWNTTPELSDSVRYANGEILAARHILVAVAADATPEVVETARMRADSLRARATPANFTTLAARSDEQGSAENGGDLGIFARGRMVPDFETAILALRPGEISPVVRTGWGFHVIYRRPFAEVRDDVSTVARQRDLAVAESVYLADLQDRSAVTLAEDAAGTAKEVARNPLGFRANTRPVANYAGGPLTASRLADWVAAYPPEEQLRPQLFNAPDTAAEEFVRQIVRNELLLRQADSAGITLDSAQIGTMRNAFRDNLLATWSTLGVDPSSLSDSATTVPEREALAGRRIEAYFDKLVKNEAQFANLVYFATKALQEKYRFAVNDVGLERVVELARARAAALP